jgi:predicted regulator of Ras-like GTPase activity (Roadblock/LC7/MglB family)
MISGKAIDIKNLLDKVKGDNPDIKEVILLSYEGLVMVSTLESGVQEDTISAMAAGINSSILRFLKALKWHAFSDILITSSKDHKKDELKEYILIKDIKNAGLLVVLTKSDVDWKRLHSHVGYAISTISAMV